MPKPKNVWMDEDSTQDEVNFAVLNNTRKTLLLSKYTPVIVGSVIITSLTQSPLFGVSYLGLAIYAFYRMRKEMKYVDELAEEGI